MQGSNKKQGMYVSIQESTSAITLDNEEEDNQEER